MQYCPTMSGIEADWIHRSHRAGPMICSAYNSTVAPGVGKVSSCETSAGAHLLPTRATYGPFDTRYAAIAIMSASSSLSTTAFISGVQAPVRVPILMSLSWR